MYSRSYYDKDGGVHTIAGGYDGTALSETPPAREEAPVYEEAMLTKSETKISPSKPKDKECTRPDEFEGCKEKQDGKFMSYIKGFFKWDKFPFSLPKKISSEDILILGLALYLFFSKTGDKECAILIALLIFL